MPTVLVKPVGDRCNLACRYCFYHPGTGSPEAVMEDDVLEAMTRRFLALGESPTIFAWQGGEPTLAGLDFFRRALVLQRRFAAEGQRVANTLQTNGLLMNDDWASFLAENDFLVGLSIDGPAECHDVFRRGRNNNPSHSLALRAWRLLQRRGCAVNILCVVNNANHNRPAEIYHHFTDELRADHLQFIPCVEWDPGGEIAGFSLQPGEYGRFLVALFDLWAAETEREISIKLFDDLVLFLAGKPMRECMHRASCDSHLVVERDGSVYPCDFFVTDDLRLGKILDQDPAELRALPRARGFREQKAKHLSTSCRECCHLDICQGGCPKFRRPQPEGGFRQYLCSDTRYFLDQRRPAMERMAASLRARWREWGAPRVP